MFIWNVIVGKKNLSPLKRSTLRWVLSKTKWEASVETEWWGIRSTTLIVTNCQLGHLTNWEQRKSKSMAHRFFLKLCFGCGIKFLLRVFFLQFRPIKLNDVVGKRLIKIKIKLFYRRYFVCQLLFSVWQYSFMIKVTVWLFKSFKHSLAEKRFDRK